MTCHHLYCPVCRQDAGTGPSQKTGAQLGFSRLARVFQRGFALGTAVVAAILFWMVTPEAQSAEITGQLGADLQGLIQFYYPPRALGESNHYFDMWDGDKLCGIVCSAGLTNNHALFINSHGTGRRLGKSKHYAYYPHQKLLQKVQPVPYYSAEDIALVVGAKRTEIHNIVVAGCDTEASFDPAELKQYFPNATNITHTVSGQPGYQPMYLQAIFSPANTIDPLYEVEQVDWQGKRQYRLTTEPHSRANKLYPYIAELYRPNSNKPFRTQIAGRELLQPPNSSVTLAGSRLGL